MRAVTIEYPRSVSCIEAEKPVPGPGEALVRIVSAGLCGSDIGAFRGTSCHVQYPRVIGHELAGVVESIPEDNGKGLRVGDKVVVDPYLYCGQCYPCRIGRTNCCASLRVLGVHVDGGMAEYLCHPANMLVRMPEDMDWVAATMAEPLTIALHAIHRGALVPGETCVVCGAGMIGLLTAMAAQAYGAHAILVDSDPERLDFARNLGIEYTVNSAQANPAEAVSGITGGEMAQLVMECTGSNACIRGALGLVSSAGRITFTDWPEDDAQLPAELFAEKEIDLRCSRASAGEFEEAIELIHTGRIDVRSLLDKTVSLEEAPQTLVDIEKNPGKPMKVVVLMEKESSSTIERS